MGILEIEPKKMAGRQRSVRTECGPLVGRNVRGRGRAELANRKFTLKAYSHRIKPTASATDCDQTGWPTVDGFQSARTQESCLRTRAVNLEVLVKNPSRFISPTRPQTV